MRKSLRPYIPVVISFCCLALLGYAMLAPVGPRPVVPPVTPPVEQNETADTPYGADEYALVGAPTTDMTKALNLVPVEQATVMAVKSGAWSDPATWGGAENVPVNGTGAKVWIPEGLLVVQDVDADIRWLRTDGAFTVALPKSAENPEPDPEPEPEPQPPTLDERIANVADENLRVILAALKARTDAAFTPMSAPELPPIYAKQDGPITLRLDTLVTGMQSRFYTPEDYAGQWNIVIIDGGPIDYAADPWAFGRGAQLMGTVDLHGREVTGYQFTTGNKPGDTKITLKNPVTGWRVGDKLVLPGTGYKRNKDTSLFDDDDVCTIAALDGNVITLAAPLKFDHGAINPYGDPRPMFVANISPRGIDFSSENPQLDRRGHVMVMRDDLMMQQNFFYCSFRDLGRTDKSKIVSDPDGKGAGLENPRARYALHYHRCKPDRWIDDARTIPSMEGRVFGCMVHGSPGWGFVNHDSFVCMQHNVAYDVWGAHFAAEIGTETGCFTSNVAIRSHNNMNVAQTEIRQGPKGNDWGKGGIGFWTHGGSLKMEGNIATGMPTNGFDAMGEGFNPGNEKTPGAVFFAIKNLLPGEKVSTSFPGWPYQGKYIATIWPPQHYERLTAWGCSRGIQFWGVNPLKSRSPVVGKSSIKDCYFECPTGIRFGYSSHVEIEDNKYYSHAADYSGGIFFTHNAGAGSNYFRRNLIRGAAQGMFVPVEGKVEISDCRFDAKLGLKITTPADVSRKLTLSNLTFDPVPGATNIYARLGDNSGLMVDQVAGGWTRALRPYGYGSLEGDETTLDGKFLYYVEEGPDFKLSEFKSMPDILKGLTTRQLREQHHIGMLSRYAAEDAAMLPGSNCVVGSRPTLLPYFRVNKNWKAVYDAQVQKTNVLQGFVLKVQEGREDGKAGAWVELPPQNLQVGWQVLEVQASGVKRGVLVKAGPDEVPLAW